MKRKRETGVDLGALREKQRGARRRGQCAVALDVVGVQIDGYR